MERRRLLPEQFFKYVTQPISREEMNIWIKEDRKNFRKGRTEEVGNETMNSVIEESLKAVANEMAEKISPSTLIDVTSVSNSVNVSMLFFCFVFVLLV